MPNLFIFWSYKKFKDNVKGFGQKIVSYWVFVYLAHH
jgi:hypothetical protein